MTKIGALIVDLYPQRKFNLKTNIMAKPIKETPFLFGKDAKDFVQENKEVVKASEEEKEEIRASYEALKEIAQFAI